MKFCTTDYVGEVTRCAKNDNNVSVGSAPHIREIYSYRRSLPFLFILRQAYSPNGNSHLDQNASIDADFLQEVPFGVSIFAKKFLGVIFASKKMKNCFNHCTSMKFLNN
jgi:hypothetical protein